MDINAIKKLTEKEGIVFLAYAGFLSQTLISGMTDALEQEAEHGGLGMTESTNIFTIFIDDFNIIILTSKNDIIICPINIDTVIWNIIFI